MAKATAGKDTKVPQPATGLRHFVATLFATLLKGVCWAVPIGVVAKINLDASVHLSTGWAAAGAVMAALGAGSVYLALHGNSAKTRTLFAVLGLVFLIGNFSNALGNIAEQSDASRDTKTAAQETVATLREQVSQVSQDRKAVAAVAGSATPAAIEAEIAAAKAADAPRWKATEQCNPDKITAGPSRTFCANLAQLAAKKAAATRRDQLDARKQQLEEELQGKPAPDSVDSFVDAVAEPIALAGYHVDAKQKRLIGVLRNWLRAFILEVLGEFGPSILLALLDMVLKPSQAAPKPVKSRGAAVAIAKGEAPAQPDAASEAKAGADGEIDAFITACVDFVAGSFVAATPLYNAWQAWCEQHGVEPGKQAAFGNRIKARITREPNNGRPRYAGIALRTADTPRLRVVS